MMQVMGNLLPMVLWGSIILLVVMVIRPILKKKSNRMMCMLWLLVTLRFLCPVAVKIPMPWLNVATSNMADAIPSVKSQEQVNNLQAAREDQSSELTESLNRTTPVNLEEFTDQKNRKSNEVFTDSAEAMNPGNPADQGNQEEKAEPADSVDSNEAMNSTDTVMMAKQVSPMNASDSAALVDRLETEDQMERTDVTDPGDRMTLDILKIFGGIWLLGTIIVLTAGLIKYWLIKRALCEAVYIAEWEKYPVRISDMSGVPLAFGIWNREIYVPVSFEKAGDGAENMFTQRQRELILWHETMHLKRRDPLRKVLAFVMVAVHWWNPLVWVCVKLMDTARQ